MNKGANALEVATWVTEPRVKEFGRRKHRKGDDAENGINDLHGGNHIELGSNCNRCKTTNISSGARIRNVIPYSLAYQSACPQMDGESCHTLSLQGQSMV